MTTAYYEIQQGGNTVGVLTTHHVRRRHFRVGDQVPLPTDLEQRGYCAFVIEPDHARVLKEMGHIQLEIGDLV